MRVRTAPVIATPPYVLTFGPFCIEIPLLDVAKHNFRTPPFFILVKALPRSIKIEFTSV